MKNARILHDEAMTQLRAAKLELEQKNYSSHKALLTEAFNLESEAAYQLRDKVGVEPTRSVLFRSAATLALECKEFDKAEQLVLNALSSAAQVPPAIRVELSRVFDAVGAPQNFTSPADAKRYYERALKIKPNHADLIAELASVLEEHFDDYEGARQYYERALELDPNSAGAYNNLAVLLVEHLKDYSTARTLYERALELNSNYVADVHYNLAILLGEYFNEYESARVHYEQAFTLDPNHADAYYNLAVIMMKHFKENNLARELYIKSYTIDRSIKTQELDAFFHRYKRVSSIKRIKRTSNLKRGTLLSKILNPDFPSVIQEDAITLEKEKKYVVKNEIE